MKFYWLKDRQQQKQFSIYWDNGKNNFADYFTKHHSPSHHKAVRPIYLYDKNNQLDMRGCIKILNDRATQGSTKRASKRTSCQTVVSNEKEVTNWNASQQEITTLLAELDSLI